jgi:phosphate/sulfate permease
MDTLLAFARPPIARRVRRFRWACIIAAACGGVGLGFAGYVVYKFSEEIIPAIGVGLGAALSVGLFLLALVVVVLWVIFPVFMYFKMNELISEVRKLRSGKQ